MTKRELFGSAVDVENVGFIAEGLDDLVHFLAGMDIEGQAQGGDAGLVIGLDGGGPDGHAVFPDDGRDLAEHIDPVVGQDGDGGVEGILAVGGPFHGTAALFFAGRG